MARRYDIIVKKYRGEINEIVKHLKEKYYIL